MKQSSVSILNETRIIFAIILLRNKVNFILIIIVGATGTIGKKVTGELTKHFQVTSPLRWIK